MRLRHLKIRSGLALFGLLACFVSADARGDKGCSGGVDVTPDALKSGSPTNCHNSRECKSMASWIYSSAKAYEQKVSQACGKVTAALSKDRKANQKSSQDDTISTYSESAGAMGSLVTESTRLQRETASKTERTIATVSGDEGLKNQAKALFHDPKRFANAKMSSGENPFARSATMQPQSALLENSAEFIYKLNVDSAGRAETQKTLTGKADEAKGNSENGGAAKEEGKGMDPSSLMGPLAALAGMANQKKDQPSDSGLSEPTAAATPAEAKLGSSVLKGASQNTAAKKAAPGSSTTATNTETGTTPPGGEGSRYGSNLSSNSPYKDAFTGFGANGTGSSSSPTSSGGGGGSGSAAGAERETASAEHHNPAEEEALQNFGGGLNFAGAGFSPASASSALPDEGVKDFLQNAETSLADGTFGETPADGEFAAQAGIEGEDGLELFRRVRSALERSQRKGAILSGLSGPKDPRYR